MARQFLDIVDQAEQLPLPIHFFLAAQGEAVQTLVCPDVAEHRLDGGKPSPVQSPAFRAINGLLHPVHDIPDYLANFPGEERDLPCRRLIRMAQAFFTQRAWQTVALGPPEFDCDKAACNAVAAAAPELFAGRANARLILWVIVKVPRAI